MHRAIPVSADRAAPAGPRTAARKAGFRTVRVARWHEMKFARLSTGANRIRTIGPALVKGLSAVEWGASTKGRRAEAEFAGLAAGSAELHRTGLGHELNRRHCQLKPPWYALRVGGAAARVGELLCSPILLPALKPSGAEKGALGPLS